jgi:hypothetical protein
MEHCEMSAEGLREAARAAIRAGTLPMPGNSWGGEPQPILTYVPKRIYCAVCNCYMREGEMPYKLTNFPGQPVMRLPECFNAWLAAAADEWAKAFDGEDFHIGDPRTTGEGCLIWASLGTRVRFFLNRSILLDVLGCASAFANDEALVRCRELQHPFIQDACRKAFDARPSGFIELQASDFV